MNEDTHDSDDIVMEVLCVASHSTLGATEPLKLAKATSSPSCQFTNARGNTRNVGSFKEIGDIAEASARRFLVGLTSK